MTSDENVSNAWIPATANDLRYLKDELKPRTKTFERVYKPIRCDLFAHRLMSNAAAEKLFGNTSRDEVSRILDFLHDLIDGISGLYLYGRKPEFGKRSYKEYNQRICDGVGSVLKRLAAT